MTRANRFAWFCSLLVVWSAVCWAMSPAAAGERQLGPYVLDIEATPPNPAPLEPVPRLELDDPRGCLLQPRPDCRLLCLGGTWCGPCVIDKPKIEAAAKAAGLSCSPYNGADVQQIDIDESPKAAARYQSDRYPLYVLVDRDGNELARQVGGGTWPTLLQQINQRAPQSSGPAGLRIGTLDGGRTSIAAVIEQLRPLLQDGGKLSVTYQAASGKPATIDVAGQPIQLGNPTQLAWTLKGDVLRCQLTPPATATVKGFPVQLRGVQLSEKRIIVDIPWLPDAEIDVR